MSNFVPKLYIWTISSRHRLQKTEKGSNLRFLRKQGLLDLSPRPNQLYLVHYTKPNLMTSPNFLVGLQEISGLTAGEVLINFIHGQLWKRGFFTVNKMSSFLVMKPKEEIWTENLILTPSLTS